MSKRVSNILKVEPFKQETINSNYISPFVDVSETAYSYLVQFDYENGTGDVEFVLTLEGSGDGINYAAFDTFAQTIQDDEGTIIFDVSGSGAEFVRLAIEHTSGTFEASCLVVGKKFH